MPTSNNVNAFRFKPSKICNLPYQIEISTLVHVAWWTKNAFAIRIFIDSVSVDSSVLA